MTDTLSYLCLEKKCTDLIVQIRADRQVQCILKYSQTCVQRPPSGPQIFGPLLTGGRYSE